MTSPQYESVAWKPFLCGMIVNCSCWGRCKSQQKSVQKEETFCFCKWIKVHNTEWSPLFTSENSTFTYRKMEKESLQHVEGLDVMKRHDSWTTTVYINVHTFGLWCCERRMILSLGGFLRGSKKNLWLMSRQPLPFICFAPMCPHLKLVHKDAASVNEGLWAFSGQGMRALTLTILGLPSRKPRGLAECPTQCGWSVNVYWVTHEWRSQLSPWPQVTKHFKERTNVEIKWTICHMQVMDSWYLKDYVTLKTTFSAQILQCFWNDDWIFYLPWETFKHSVVSFERLRKAPRLKKLVESFLLLEFGRAWAAEHVLFLIEQGFNELRAYLK